MFLINLELYKVKICQKNVIPWILKNNPKISSEINSRLEMANKISEKEYLKAIEFKNKLVANLNENLTSEMFAIFPTTPFSAPKFKSCLKINH